MAMLVQMTRSRWLSKKLAQLEMLVSERDVWLLRRGLAGR